MRTARAVVARLTHIFELASLWCEQATQDKHDDYLALLRKYDREERQWREVIQRANKRQRSAESTAPSSSVLMHSLSAAQRDTLSSLHASGAAVSVPGACGW